MRKLWAAAAAGVVSLSVAVGFGPLPQAYSAPNSVVINEVESNNGTPGDWIELTNPTSAPIDVSGWVVKDNDDTHEYVLPAGSVIAPGGFLVAEESALGFGLGKGDSARLFNGGTLIDSYVWTAHASTTYGRCPSGTGAFTTTVAETKGAVNDCGATTPTPTPTPTPEPEPVKLPIVFNEVESTGGVPGDWAELRNNGGADIDLSGFVFKDADDTHAYTLPAGSVIKAGGYLVLDEANFGFGLGSNESVRLFSPAGTLVTDHSWTVHATGTTYGRCPDGTGDFTTTTTVTKGAANDCSTPEAPTGQPWPGGQDVTVVDAANTFSGDLSGLDYGNGTLWGVNNGEGLLYRLAQNGTTWAPTSTLKLHYPDGSGTPDAEGLTVGPDGMVYVGTERNNDAGGVPRDSILMYDPAGNGTALQEWNLTSALPITGANVGIEAVEWVPDSALTGLIDTTTGQAYDPARYPLHGSGLFIVGVESTGTLYAFALNSDGTHALVGTLQAAQSHVMALDYDTVTGTLWALCDDTCQGVASAFDLASGSTKALSTLRPAGMANLNNEGFATGPKELCSNGVRPVWWADDGDTDGNSLRAGTMTCPAVVTPTPTPTTEPTPSHTPTPTAEPTSTPTAPQPGKDAEGGLADTGV